MNKELKCYFSLISGEIYYVEPDEVKNLDSAQIPLKSKPKCNCKTCYGRFYVGKHSKMVGNNWQHDYYIPCPKCSQKYIDFDNLKDVEVHSTHTTTDKADDVFENAVKLV